jgi:hypothetical protein
LHVAQILYRDRVGHSVPDGGLLFLQVGKAINGGLGFEKIERHGGNIISLSGEFHHGGAFFSSKFYCQLVRAKGKNLLFTLFVVNITILQTRSCATVG